MVKSKLGLLTGIVTAMIVIDALWTVGVVSLATFAPVLFQLYIFPSARAVDLAQLCFKLATAVVFCWWLYVAGRNLVEAGIDDLEFSPASRIWWFFVPFACLVKPYEGMRELWNASRGNWTDGGQTTLVATWWGLWLLKGLIAWIRGAAGHSALWLWFESATDIAAAIAAILVLQGIAKAQMQHWGPALGEVFA